MFKWNEKFSVGVEILDNQHKKLLQIGASIFETFNIDSFDKYDKIVHLLDELHDYTVEHFDTEEKLLKENNVEFTLEHKKQHDEFVYKLYDLKSIDIDNSQSEILLQTLDFISNWISNHILKTDMGYKGLL